MIHVNNRDEQLKKKQMLRYRIRYMTIMQIIQFLMVTYIFIHCL